MTWLEVSTTVQLQCSTLQRVASNDLRLREKTKYKVKRIREQMVQDNELLKDGARFTLIQKEDSDCEQADEVNTILRKIERLRRRGKTSLIEKWVMAMTEEQAKIACSTVGRRIK